MADGDIVDNITVHVTVSVREWTVDGETKYDWIADSGLDSIEYFNSIEEALDDGAIQVGG